MALNNSTIFHHSKITFIRRIHLLKLPIIKTIYYHNVLLITIRSAEGALSSACDLDVVHSFRLQLQPASQPTKVDVLKVVVDEGLVDG